MFELITGQRPYYWMAEELVFRYRLDQQAAGSTASTYEEALVLPPAKRCAVRNGVIADLHLFQNESSYV